MKRLGLFTGSGVVGALLVPLFVVVSAFATGGGIFSSGPLNADQGPAPVGGAWSHADLACGDCHAPFWSSELMGDRCLVCHTDVAQELATPNSLHAGIASPQSCRTCHPEHRGAHATLTLYAPDLYPHAGFGFYLIGHLSHPDGLPFTCSDCHIDTSRPFTQETCIECHQGLDSGWMATHELDFGFDCLACHDGIDTYGARFDHRATAFPLEGHHLGLACSTCHAGADNLDDLRSAPTDCIGCHGVNDVHQGSLGAECAGCHTPDGWSRASFDHGLTGFPLIGGHLGVACETCHVGGRLSGVSPACVDCHLADDPHAGKFGRDCSACHTAEDWSILVDGSFDHGLTGFPLTGAHARVAACTSCHKGGPFTGTPTACAACHSGDDAHKGAFGTQCGSCHTTDAWRPANFDHGQTGFQLSGGHAGVACAQCHPGDRFQGTPTACAACHTADEPANHFEGACSNCHTTSAWLPARFNHSGLTDCTSCHTQDKPANHFSGQCSQCHATTAWKPARFDHSGLTDCTSCHTQDKPTNHFSGQCSQCHATSAWLPARFDHSGLTDCASCHTQDKPANHFSGQCSQCHATTAWKPSTFNHSNTAFPLTGSHTGVACSKCHVDGVYAGTPKGCSSCHGAPSSHPGFYGSGCTTCHNTSDWSVRYSASHPFPMTHKGANSVCTKCHTDSFNAYTCYKCHDPSETQKHHENIGDLSDCAACHPKGKSD